MSGIGRGEPGLGTGPAVGDEVGHETDIGAVAHDELVVRVFVVGTRDGPVLREVVDPDHFITTFQEDLCDMHADESGGTGDEKIHSERIIALRTGRPNNL